MKDPKLRQIAALLAIAACLGGCASGMVDATKLQKSTDLIVPDYVRLLRASDKADAVKAANEATALGLKELVDRAVDGTEAAAAKRKAVVDALR